MGLVNVSLLPFYCLVIASLMLPPCLVGAFVRASLQFRHCLVNASFFLCQCVWKSRVSVCVQKKFFAFRILSSDRDIAGAAARQANFRRCQV